MLSFSQLVLAGAALISSASAGYNPSSKNNVVMYWGQGPNQQNLATFCANPNANVIVIGFVDAFPDESPGNYPGTNFGNMCGSEVYQNNGVNTKLLSNCPSIGPDIVTCQQTYGKTILLSIGGGYPTNYYIKDDSSAVYFAEFLWAAFGPASLSNGTIPRPFGNASVDGFDFDIESQISPAPIPNYQSNGYVPMVNYLKNTLFPQDNSKPYYLSATPQCILPDIHLSSVITNAYFDWVQVQFYNTFQCSARAGINHLNGVGQNDISYGQWTSSSSKNPSPKFLIGLPASTAAVSNATYYLPPAQVLRIVNEFYSSKARFGGIMIYEATYSKNNLICGMPYVAWMKKVLTAAGTNTPLSPDPSTCKTATIAARHVHGRRHAH